MRVSVEFIALTNQRGFLEWLAVNLTRPDIIALETVSFPDVEKPSNVRAFAQGLDEAREGGV